MSSLGSRTEYILKSSKMFKFFMLRRTYLNKKQMHCEIMMFFYGIKFVVFQFLPWTKELRMAIFFYSFAQSWTTYGRQYYSSLHKFTCRHNHSKQLCKYNEYNAFAKSIANCALLLKSNDRWQQLHNIFQAQCIQKTSTRLVKWTKKGLMSGCFM